METIRLTTAKAIVNYLIAQKSVQVDGSIAPLFGGVYGIFGHGNVTALGHALEQAKTELPTYRGQKRTGHGTGWCCVREGQTPSSNHGRDLFSRAWCHQHGDGCWRRPQQSVAVAADLGRLVHEPTA